MSEFPACPACGEKHWSRLEFSRHAREQHLWAIADPENPGYLTTEDDYFLEAMEPGQWICGDCQKAPSEEIRLAIEEIYDQASKILPF
jgi:hypothetical protein